MNFFVLIPLLVLLLSGLLSAAEDTTNTIDARIVAVTRFHLPMNDRLMGLRLILDDGFDYSVTEGTPIFLKGQGAAMGDVFAGARVIGAWTRISTNEEVPRLLLRLDLMNLDRSPPETSWSTNKLWIEVRAAAEEARERMMKLQMVILNERRIRMAAVNSGSSTASDEVTFRDWEAAQAAAAKAKELDQQERAIRKRLLNGTRGE